MATEQNTAQPSRAVTIVGDPNRAEMRSLVDWICNRLLPPTIPVFACDITTAKTQCATKGFPDLVIVLQGWPGEFSASQISEFLSFTPLSRIVVCYGAWCESDGRNQNPPLWPNAVRVPVWAAAARIEREWRLINDDSAGQAMPWSASREEIFAADHADLPRWQLPSPVLIDSPDPDYQQFLSQLLKSTGYEIATEVPGTILFDADPWGPERTRILGALRDQHPDARIVALTSLCQPDQATQLHLLGAVQIINKLGIRSLDTNPISSLHSDVPSPERDST